MDEGNQSRDDTPAGHAGADVHTGPCDFVGNKVGRDLSEDVSHKEDAVFMHVS